MGLGSRVDDGDHGKICLKEPKIVQSVRLDDTVPQFFDPIHLIVYPVSGSELDALGFDGDTFIRLFADEHIDVAGFVQDSRQSVGRRASGRTRARCGVNCRGRDDAEGFGGE